MALDYNFLRRLLEEKIKERRQRYYAWYLAGISFAFLITSFYFLYFKAPSQFPFKTIATIKQSSGLNEIARDLFEQKIIKSPFWFRILVVIIGGEKWWNREVR